MSRPQFTALVREVIEKLMRSAATRSSSGRQGVRAEVGGERGAQ